MKVVCDNCGALYKIPDDKLVKPVNKATCRQCGHRMLIPRPRRGADPDERTLVTAVPPTPAPPPMRDDSGPPTTPLHTDSEEKTLPTGAPPTEETRWIRNDLQTRPRAHSGADRPDRNAMTERVPAHGGPSSGSGASTSNDRSPSTDVSLLDNIDPHAEHDPTPRDSARQQRSSEPDRQDKVGRDRQDKADRPSKAEPRRKSKSSAGTDRAAHDPRRDMGLALFGVIVASLGVLILGVDAVIDAGPGAYWIVLSTAVLGTTLACGGLVGAFLVLFTSGRGRKPAWRVASVILAILVGVVAGAVPASVRLGVDSAASISEQVNQLMARTGPPIQDPSLADLPSDDDPDPDPDLTDVDAADDTAAPSEEPAEDGAADDPTDDGSADARTDDASSDRTGSPAGTATQRSDDRSTTSSSRRRVTISESEPAREPARTPPAEELRLPDDISDLDTPPRQASNPNLPAKPAMQAIDIMVKTNVNVKRCFYEYQKAEGKLPSRLDVPFAIKPSGDATDISVKQSRYAGGELEACLIKAIRGITFPPSQQGTSLTFPFVL